MAEDIPIPAHLAGVAAKLIRARDLLDELDSLVIQYLFAHRPSFDVVPDAESCSYTVTAHVEPPPLLLAVIFGDVLHNLRSALDHVARLMVISNGGSPINRPPGATMFPVLEKEPNRPVNIHPGIGSEARVVLSSLQPYQWAEPRKHPLWRLNELSNIDKHRLLHVTSLSGAGGVAFVPAPLDPTLSTTQEQRRHLVRMLPEEPQHFTVRADEMHAPATIAGAWSSTVVLGEPNAGFREQLVGIGRSILAFLAEEALPELAPFTLPPA